MRKVKILFLSLIVSCIFLNSISAMAADERLGTVVDGSLLTDGSEAEGIVQPIARGAYLGSGNGRLSINSGRNVNVFGSTSCVRTSDQVRVTLHLQRLSGNTWVTVQTLGPKSAYNTYYVSNSGNYSVAGGYYYRVKGSHTAIKGETTETTVSYTDGLWIN